MVRKVAEESGQARLFVWRFCNEHRFDFETIQEAAEEAIGQIDAEVSYPDRIEVDGEIVWEQLGPGNVRLSLEKLVGGTGILLAEEGVEKE